MEWVAKLKHHSRETYQQIEMFFDDYWIEPRPTGRLAQYPLREARIFHVWVRALPDAQDTDAWKWFEWAVCQYQTGCLKPVIRYFGDMLALNEAGAVDERFKSLLPRAQNIYRDLRIVLDCYEQCDRAFSTDGYGLAEFNALLATKTQCLPASTILVLLWPHIYPEYVDITLDLDEFDMGSWPAVPYHPNRTATALYDAVIRIVDERLNALTIAGREDDEVDLLVIPRRTDTAFEIRVTHPTVTMTPALWERYQTTLQHRSSLEHLRELGGSIEPLTWDEGQGQGVIVRLPWAK
jgi:hypothetical protein